MLTISQERNLYRRSVSQLVCITTLPSRHNVNVTCRAVNLLSDKPE